jgi:hypothetical protein
MRCAPRWSIAGRSALRKKNNPKPAGAISARHQEVCIYMEANNFSSYIFSDHAPPTFQSFQPPAVQRTRHTTLLLHPGGTWPGSLFSSTICFSCIFTRSVSTIALCRRRWLFRCGLFCARTNHCLDRLFGAPLCSHALDSSNLVVMMSILEKQYCTIKESWPFPCVCSMQLSSLIGRFVFRSRGAGTYSYVLRKSLAVRHIFTRLSEKRIVPHI